MKHILFILLLLPTLISAQVLKEYELCSIFIQKEIKANTSANTTVWSINPFIPFQVDADVMYINASDENSVDAVRDKVKRYASTVGFKRWKIV
jgi:hypothetical protein